MDFFYTKIENSGPATARIGIKGHAPLSQFLNSSFILQLREFNFSLILFIFLLTSVFIHGIIGEQSRNGPVAQLVRAHP